jgi:hypothetical protein
VAIIRDGTGPTSKEPYKRMRGLVENHFYPKLANGPRMAAPPKSPLPTGSNPPAKTMQPTWQPFFQLGCSWSPTPKRLHRRGTREAVLGESSYPTNANVAIFGRLIDFREVSSG